MAAAVTSAPKRLSAHSASFFGVLPLAQALAWVAGTIPSRLPATLPQPHASPGLIPALHLVSQVASYSLAVSRWPVTGTVSEQLASCGRSGGKRADDTAGIDEITCSLTCLLFFLKLLPLLMYFLLHFFSLG